jgi:hypothetical protein
VRACATAAQAHAGHTFISVGRPLNWYVRLHVNALPSALQARLWAYQRDLARHMLVPMLVFFAMVATLVFFFETYGSRWPSTYRAWVAIVAAFVLSQLMMFLLRRNITTLSRTHGLVCPSCGAAMGFRYSTLRRTGKCGACGASVLSEMKPNLR